jgi:hypothetical protein
VEPLHVHGLAQLPKTNALADLFGALPMQKNLKQNQYLNLFLPYQ